MNPMRMMLSKLPGKLGGDGGSPRNIFAGTRMGYWIPEGDAATGADDGG